MTSKPYLHTYADNTKYIACKLLGHELLYISGEQYAYYYCRTCKETVRRIVKPWWDDESEE